MAMIKKGMDNRQMKKIAMGNMAKGAKPMAIKGTKYKKKPNDNDADDMKMKKKTMKGGKAAQMQMQAQGGMMQKKAQKK